MGRDRWTKFFPITQPLRGHLARITTSLTTFALCISLSACSNMQGVNVGASVPIGPVRVGADKTLEGSSRTKRSRERPSDAQNLRLYVFDCGSIKMQDVSAFGLTNQDTNVRELFVPCYLVEHPTKGRLLWDAGLPLSVVGAGEQPLQEGTTQEYRESLLKQMARMRLRPGDIDYVAFSHFHFDHVGAANAFTDANLLIQETEYEAAFKNHEAHEIFQYELYSELANSTKTLLSGDHDVFGDGSATIISAPGHTPGHQVLLLKLKKFGALVLSGDLYHFEASRRLRATPVFNTDREQTLASMDKVEALIKKHKARLWIEHNKQLADTLNLAPAYYD